MCPNTQLPARWARRTAGAVLGVCMLALCAIVVLAAVPSSWVGTKTNARLGVEQPTPYALTPATAAPVGDLLQIGELDEKATRYPTRGQLMYVTVSTPDQSALGWLLGSEHPAVSFMTHEDKYGAHTPAQRRAVSLQMMRTSEQVAQYVALKELGYAVKLVPGEVVVRQILCLEVSKDGYECVKETPSGAVLEPGDRIKSVAGVEVATVEDLGAQLRGFSPTDVVEMVIERAGEDERTVSVQLTASPNDPSRTIVGFYPSDTSTVELPFELDISTRGIGGPSAGLAFTLSLIDELSAGELTGANRVAVTGTINLDGTVGPIGGLAQKGSAVAQNGVKYFLVPTAQGEADIARARAAAGPGVEIVPVADLGEALEALRGFGGDPLEKVALAN